MEARERSDVTLTPKTETFVHSLRSSDLKDAGHKHRRINHPKESGIRWFLQFCQLTILREFPGLREDKGNWAEVSGLKLRVWGNDWSWQDTVQGPSYQWRKEPPHTVKRKMCQGVGQAWDDCRASRKTRVWIPAFMWEAGPGGSLLSQHQGDGEGESPGLTSWPV